MAEQKNKKKTGKIGKKTSQLQNPTDINGFKTQTWVIIMKIMYFLKDFYGLCIIFN
jgi:hypothetical protein